MWKSRPKSKSSREIDNNIDGSIRRSSPNLNFFHSSLKDVVNLLSDDVTNSLTKTLAQPSPTRRLSIFHRVHLANKFGRAFSSNLSPSFTKSHSADNKLTKSLNSRQSNRQIFIPGAENRIIIYTTSLRVVRRTFEACRAVKSILGAFRVLIEERDLSMDSKFLTELHNIMKQSGEENIQHKVELPMVFIGGKYIGGAEEVKELHETGELNKCLERLPAVTGGVCEVCGDYRFVVCDECCGSRKCYSQKAGFRSCILCNENGLVRCPLCF